MLGEEGGYYLLSPSVPGVNFFFFLMGLYSKEDEVDDGDDLVIWLDGHRNLTLCKVRLMCLSYMIFF